MLVAADGLNPERDGLELRFHLVEFLDIPTKQNLGSNGLLLLVGWVGGGGFTGGFERDLWLGSYRRPFVHSLRSF